MSLEKQALKCFLKLIIVLAGLLTILFFYTLMVFRHGLISVLSAGSLTDELMIFNVFATLPIAVILIWPLINQRWPDIYITAFKYKGIWYLVDLTRWRAGFITSVISLCLIEMSL